MNIIVKKLKLILRLKLLIIIFLFLYVTFLWKSKFELYKLEKVVSDFQFSILWKLYD